MSAAQKQAVSVPVREVKKDPEAHMRLISDLARNQNTFETIKEYSAVLETLHEQQKPLRAKWTAAMQAKKFDEANDALLEIQKVSLEIRRNGAIMVALAANDEEAMNEAFGWTLEEQYPAKIRVEKKQK